MPTSNIRKHNGITPTIATTAWVDDTAVVIGDVRLEAQVSVWPTVVLRGDQGRITIDTQSNIQDGSVVHSTGGISSTYVGKRCTVGHRVILHGCYIEDDCLIGMGSIVLDNARIGTGSIIGAGAVVTAKMQVPPHSLVLGCPAKVVKTISKEEHEKWITHGCEEYLKLLDEVQNS
jgi:carbonic anhydrase/acetyltransferase-like protein (isoleucine patch superfamily)